MNRKRLTPGCLVFTDEGTVYVCLGSRSKSEPNHVIMLAIGLYKSAPCLIESLNVIHGDETVVGETCE